MLIGINLWALKSISSLVKIVWQILDANFLIKKFHLNVYFNLAIGCTLLGIFMKNILTSIVQYKVNLIFKTIRYILQCYTDTKKKDKRASIWISHTISLTLRCTAATERVWDTSSSWTTCESSGVIRWSSCRCCRRFCRRSPVVEGPWSHIVGRIVGPAPCSCRLGCILWRLCDLRAEVYVS